MSDFDTYDEYKFLAEDTAKMTDRRQNISNLYTTINSILLAAVAVLFTDAGLNHLAIILSTLLIAIAGVVISISWKNMIQNYRNLLRLRFDVLYEMEETPQMKDSVKIYHRESEELYPRDEEEGKFQDTGLFANIEKQLPNIFIGLYIILGAGIITLVLTNQFA